MNVSFTASKNYGKTAQSVASALVFSPISEQIEMVALLDPAGPGKPTFLNVRINYESNPHGSTRSKSTHSFKKILTVA